MPISSPFEQVHRQLGARFDTYGGWSLPADFGNPDTESDAVQNHCAVMDLCSFGRIQANGSAVKDVLNNIFSEKSGNINTDSWVWAKTRTLDGRDTLCRIVKTNGDVLILTHPSDTQSLCDTLTSQSGGQVDFSNITQKTAMLGLYGPKSFDSMRGVLPFDIDHLDTGDAEKKSFMMLSFTLIRGSWLAGEGLELICPAAAGSLAAGAVAKYRHKHNLTPAGMDCLQAALALTPPPL